MSREIPAALRSVVADYAERVRALFGSRLREVRLFGSFARGEANEDSDVDLLVLVDGLRDTEIGLVAGEAGPLAARSGLPLAPRCRWRPRNSRR